MLQITWQNSGETLDLECWKLFICFFLCSVYKYYKYSNNTTYATHSWDHEFKQSFDSISIFFMQIKTQSQDANKQSLYDLSFLGQETKLTF